MRLNMIWRITHIDEGMVRQELVYVPCFVGSTKQMSSSFIHHLFPVDVVQSIIVPIKKRIGISTSSILMTMTLPYRLSNRLQKAMSKSQRQSSLSKKWCETTEMIFLLFETESKKVSCRLVPNKKSLQWTQHLKPRLSSSVASSVLQTHSLSWLLWMTKASYNSGKKGCKKQVIYKGPIAVPSMEKTKPQ